MPSIRITDSLTADIISANAGPGSGISKYFKGNVAAFIASSEVVLALNKSIATLAPGELGTGLTFAAGGSFGTSDIDWKLGGGSAVTVSATQTGAIIPGDELFANPMTVGQGQTAFAVAFSPTLSSSISSSLGDLQFGFDAGGMVLFRSGRAYDVAAQAPSVKEALEDLLTTGIVPGNVIDLKDMKPGDFGSVAGSGEVKISGSFNIAKAINPLLSPTLLLKQIGSVKIDAGASLTVSAGVAVRGRYQVRIQKLTADKVRIGYYKMSGSAFEFGVTASAGVSVTLQKRELLAQLMGMLGATKADVTALVEAGVSDQQIEDIKAAVEASLSRSIAISLAGSFASSGEETKVFEYEFDLNKLGHDGVTALENALQADLSTLTSADVLPAGTRLLHSEFELVRTKKTVWKINLLGIMNVMNMHELVRTGKMLFNAETGELVITDAVMAKKIRIELRPLEAETRKLHKVLLQSLVMTAAYRASGVQKLLDLTGSMTYFDQVSNAKRANVSDMLDNFVCAKFITSDEKAAFLDAQVFSGRASVFFDLMLTDNDFSAMFLDSAGVPRTQDEYEIIARQCMGELVQPGDELDFRRIAFDFSNEGVKLWKKMRNTGPAALATVLPQNLQDPARLEIIRRDYIIIAWWSNSMTKTAKAVAGMRAFLTANGDDAAALQNNNEFKNRHKHLANALEDVADDSLPDFVDAWGLLAIFAAARRLAALRAIMVTTKAVLVKSREGAAHHA